MFVKSRWFSHRVNCAVTMARWGTVGQPVLILPTAGGDAEEIERFHLIKSVAPLLEQKKIKIYSVDSVGGRTWFYREGSPEHRMKMQDLFHQFIREEVVPAIRMDCKTDDIPIWVGGASIGAFHSAAVLCRYPDVFTKAICMSGTYNLMRFIEAKHPTDDFRRASPLYFLPHVGGRHLELLRQRYIHIVTGEGRWESLPESWGLANALGAKQIPNYVENWGPDWHHDWITWRAMLPKILGEWTAHS